MKPPLKFVGGKRRLLKEIRKRMPKHIRRYYEPFAGGAAVFFDGHEQFQEATLGDVNVRLMECYQALADNVEAVIEHVNVHKAQHCSNHYYLVREELNEGAEGSYTVPEQRAAALLYLNRSCFNGLWRVNREGRNNVPMGRYKQPFRALTDELLRETSEALQNVELILGDFLLTSSGAVRGDLCYMDPPYVPVNQTSNFTTYSEGGFTLRDQEELADRARMLARRGVNVMLSNSDTPLVHELYKDDFRIDIVECGRSINSKTTSRGKVREVLITSYEYEVAA